MGEKGRGMKSAGVQQLRGADVLIARRRAGVKQKELAAKMGTTEAMLVQAENERVELSQTEYQRMLGVIEEMKGEGGEAQT